MRLDFGNSVFISDDADVALAVPPEHPPGGKNKSQDTHREYPGH
jgi:hypothetical protein